MISFSCKGPFIERREMNNKNVFLNEKVAKKLFKSKLYGKILSAKVISDVIEIDYDDIYNNIKLSTDEIAFSSKTLNSTADAIYYDDIHYFNIEINFHRSPNKKRQIDSYPSFSITSTAHLP